MALSLYRKYRPEVFEDVVGQEHVEKTLVNAVVEGTVAHAYLFCGPRGTGKTTTARLLAKALLCEHGPTVSPDGTCVQCQEIAQGTHPDVNELDAASRTGVDNVREEIIGRVNFAPTHGRYKIYIIDEVHMLSNAAFNALLKTLEEPPEHVIFVLCTTDPHKVPETIQSRCQRFDFRRFSIEEIVGYLTRVCNGEGYTFEPEALEFIAAKSAGGMRDATTALEQVGVFTGGNITLEQTMGMFGQIDVAALFEISSYIARRDTASCFLWVNDLVGKGCDFAQFARDLTSHMRNLYVTALTGGGDGIVPCTASQLEQYRQQAAEFGGPERLVRILNVCGNLVSELRNSLDARLSVEIAMTRLCHPEGDLTIDALAERIEALEQGMPAQAPRSAVAEDGWGRVEPQQPRWQQVAEQRNEQRREEGQRQQDAGIPLREAVARESELEQVLQDRANDVAEQQVRAEEQAASVKPQPQAQPQQGGRPMSTARLLAAILTVVKRDDVPTGALLNGVSLEKDASGYQLLFPAGTEFAMRLASTGDARKLIGRAFEEVLGEPVNFDCRIATLAGQAAGQGVQVQTAEPDPIQDDAYFESLEASSHVEEPTAREAYTAPSEMFAENNEPDFDAPLNGMGNRPVDDETAANIADALSAFGKGVKVREIRDEQ